MPFLILAIGAVAAYEKDLLQYNNTVDFININASKYGLESPLDEEHQEFWSSISPEPLIFRIPTNIYHRVEINLFTDKVHKTCQNFTELCKGFQKKKQFLHFKNTPIHRCVRDLIAQGGDVTRFDGSGGESIFSSAKFNDEPAGLKERFKKGSVGMANKGKNSNSSQFFLCLGDGERTAKLNGKYVCFGEIKEECFDVLDLLNAASSPECEIPLVPIIVSDCGL